MHHVIDAIQRAVQAILIAHITDKEANALVTLEPLGHVPLFHFVAGENNDLLRVVFGQCHRHERIAEGAGTAGNEDGLVAEH